MALLVLAVLGATLGWLMSIVTRREAPREILSQIGAGLVATLIAGLIANEGTFLGSLSLAALAAGMVAGVVILLCYHLMIGRKFKA